MQRGPQAVIGPEWHAPRPGEGLPAAASQHPVIWLGVWARSNRSKFGRPFPIGKGQVSAAGQQSAEQRRWNGPTAFCPAINSAADGTP